MLSIHQKTRLLRVVKQLDKETGDFLLCNVNHSVCLAFMYMLCTYCPID